MNGKGDRARSNYSQQFRDNFSKINWGRKTAAEQIQDYFDKVSGSKFPKLKKHQIQ